MQNTRLFRGTIAIVAGLLLLLALSITAAQDESQPVFRIGVLDDPRGSITRGAQLAVREINAGGGVTGADGTQFRLEIVNAQTGAGDTLDTAIDTLEQARIIAVLGPSTNDDVLGNLPLLQSLGVPILTPATGDTIIASDATATLFRLRAAERLMGAALADYLVNDLNFSEITTVQLDRLSTASRVGFSFALGQLANSPQETNLLLDSGDELSDLVADVVTRAPSVVVLYGGPDLARDFYTLARDSGWVGTLVYDQALNPAFSETVDLERLSGIITPTTWSVDSGDTTSTRFILDYVRSTGDRPDAIAASAFDGIQVLAEAISQPGDLLTNLQSVREVPGVQGLLNPPSLGTNSREISDSVMIVELNSLGGPELVARYSGQEQVPLDEPEIIVEAGTPSPTVTPTPDGLVITIESAVQNVRTGPSLEYEVLGQVRQGETFQVIGANIDFSWVVIQYRGQQGWLATFLLDVFGDRGSVPVIAPPPTPTPGPATATPTPPAIPDIVVLSVSPATIVRGQATQVRAIVRNQGGAAAGPFAVASTFRPSDFFTAVNLDGLAAGTEREIILPVNITGATGNYTVAIVSDLNEQVNEGPEGEANNIFNYTYKLDQPSFGINSATLGSGSSLDLNPALTINNDITYTGAGLQTVGTCDGSNNCIGLLSPTLTWDTAHFDAVASTNGINAGFISNAALQPGTAIGVLTAEGARGVIRIDAIQPGVSITFTYRVYQAASP